MATEVSATAVSRNATMVSAQEENSQSECGILLSSLILSQEIPLQANPTGQPAKEKKIKSIFDKLAQTACMNISDFK